MSNRRAVRLEWQGSGMRFSGAGTDPSSPAITIDGDGIEGPSPMLTLLLAAGGCSASDVVLLMEKMQVSLTSLVVEVEGVRREDDPRRYMSIRFRFVASGESITRKKLERAVQLSVGKYCSVVHTLAPDVAVDYELAIA